MTRFLHRYTPIIAGTILLMVGVFGLSHQPCPEHGTPIIQLPVRHLTGEEHIMFTDNDQGGCIRKTTPTGMIRVNRHDYTIGFLDADGCKFSARATNPNAALAALKLIGTPSLVTFSMRGKVLGLQAAP